MSIYYSYDNVQQRYCLSLSVTLPHITEAAGWFIYFLDFDTRGDKTTPVQHCCMFLKPSPVHHTCISGGGPSSPTLKVIQCICQMTEYLTIWDYLTPSKRGSFVSHRYEHYLHPDCIVLSVHRLLETTVPILVQAAQNPVPWWFLSHVLSWNQKAKSACSQRQKALWPTNNKMLSHKFSYEDSLKGNSFACLNAHRLTGGNVWHKLGFVPCRWFIPKIVIQPMTFAPSNVPPPPFTLWLCCFPSSLSAALCFMLVSRKRTTKQVLAKTKSRMKSYQ